MNTKTAMITIAALHKAIGHEEISARAFPDHGTVASIDIGFVYALPCCTVILGDGFHTADAKPRIFSHEGDECAVFDFHDADLAKLIASIVCNNGFRPRFAAVIAVIAVLHEHPRFGGASVNAENMSAV